jgi:DNA-binding response OmpR family regulator
MLTLMGTVLTGAGYQVFCAVDPAQGLEAIHRERPAAVICDILMPGMDGYEVHRRLRMDPDGIDCAFLFVSGLSDFTQRLRAFGVGGVDFMAKPFTPAILVRKVERLLEQPPRPHRAPQMTETEHAAVRPPRSISSAEVQMPDELAVPPAMRRVLLVDDCREYRDFLRQLLARYSFTVFEATSAEEGLQMALDEQPWLALVDVSLPGMDGFELCRRFRSQPLLKHVPVIFLSARDDYEDRRKGYEAGGDEYLPKVTTHTRELLMRISLVLGRLTESVGWTRRSVGMQGDIEVIGPTGVLQMFHLSRLSGTCRVRHGAHEVTVQFKNGEIVAANDGKVSGPEAVFSFLAWTAGHFEFTPGDSWYGADAAFQQSFSELLLDGCRRLDEARR